MKGKRLLLSAAATLLSLAIAEVVVRGRLPPPGYRPFPEDQPRGLYVPHPVRHFAYAPGFSGRIDAREYRIRVAINSLGMRDDPVVPGERIDVLAVGDSFTVGFGVEADEAWPAVLEADLNAAGALPQPVRVLNAAVSAYGIAQVRSSVEQWLALRPQIVVVGLYPAGAWRLLNPYVLARGYIVRRDSVPHYDVAGDHLVYTRFDGRLLQRIHLWTMKHYHTGAWLLERMRVLGDREPEHEPEPERTAAEELAPLLAELEAIDRLCASHGAGLFVLLVNSQAADGTFAPRELEDNAEIARFCRARGIALHDPVPAFRRASHRPAFRIGGDAHWSRAAHRLAGRGLAAALLGEDRLRERLGGATASGLAATVQVTGQEAR